MTHDEAVDTLPAGATWLCSFGNRGMGGYVAVFRLGRQCWEVSNGRWDACQPFDWTVQQVDDLPVRP